MTGLLFRKISPLAAGKAMRRADAPREVAERRLRAREAQLAASERKFRAITDAVAQMVWSARPDGGTDFFNQRWYDYTGLPEGSTDSAARADVIHPDDRDRARACWRDCLVTGDPYEVEFRMRHRSGAYRWVLGRAVPLRDGQGRIAQWVGTCTDIQEIVEAREVLAQSRQRLAGDVADSARERDRTWRNSQDLLLVCDTQGIIRAANPAWTRILGWQPADLLGRNHLDIVDPDSRGTGAANGASLADSPPHHEGRMRHKDGSTRWVAWTALPDEGMIYVSGRHITAEKEATQALAQAEEQLRQSQKMQAVGQLTGGIAHDFNNLLPGIIGNLELMQRRITAGRLDGLDRFASMAVASAERAAALTQRLLAFARSQPLDPKRVEANRLLSGMEDLLRRTLGPTVSLEMTLAPTLWPTLCDPNQLENAVLNLAINARDAMPKGGRLMVETANVQLEAAYAEAQGGVRAGQYVALSVTDTGSGMGPEVIARAFDPFFTTKPTGQGTGLGLSMLYGFVKQCDGHVRVASEPDLGTTFKIYLPRCRSE